MNLSREISFNELKRIIDKNNIEIEVFIHGALCISYSGRCMLSKYMSGRDANKGKCAHSCRWKYYLMEKKRPNLFFPIVGDEKGTYIYNSRDLCLLPRLSDLIAAGVRNFKIEGRMKTENYVSLATWTYRKAIDEILENSFTPQKLNFLISELDKSSHRNFTQGFMFLEDKEELEDNDNVGYIKKYRFAATCEGYSNKYKGPILKVKNQFMVGENMDVLQPFKDPIIFPIKKIVDSKNDKPANCVNPNDLVILPETEQFDIFSIFRIK